MSDPRFDQNYQDPRLSDPVQRYDDVGANSPWSWIAGLGVLALIIVFLVIGGHNTNQQTAGNGLQSPAATGSNPPIRDVTPRSTTGMGSPMQPTQPAQSQPSQAPANSQ